MKTQPYHSGLGELKKGPRGPLSTWAFVHQGNAHFATFEGLQAGVVRSADDLVVILVARLPLPGLHPVQMPALLVRLGVILPRFPGGAVP